MLQQMRFGHDSNGVAAMAWGQFSFVGFPVDEEEENVLIRFVADTVEIYLSICVGTRLVAGAAINNSKDLRLD